MNFPNPAWASGPGTVIVDEIDSAEVDLAVLVEGEACECCCCTGECRGTASWQLEAEEREHALLSAGFEEGDAG